MSIVTLASFILGLAVGSFLNVLVLRTRAGERPLGRSRCPHCKRQLAWYELVPLASFLVQRGRCRRCGKKLSWQYPLVEAATGALFALVAYVFLPGAPLMTLWLWGALALTLALLVYDLKYLELPDAWVLVLTLWVLAGIFVLARDTIGIRVLAGFAPTLFFGALYAASGGRWIGGGDVKLAFPLGLLAGWPGVLVLFGTAYLLGALVAVPLLTAGRAGRKTALPFGPFLIIGAYVALFFGDTLLTWYLSLLF